MVSSNYSYLMIKRICLHTFISYQVFLSNTNNFHAIMWFQVFLSNTNSLYTIISFKVDCYLTCPVGWGCRIHQQLLCRGVRLPPPHSNEYPGYDIKQSDGEVPVMLEFWRMRSTPLLSSLKVVAPDKGPICGLNRTKPWFEFTVFLHLNYVFMLNWIV